MEELQEIEKIKTLKASYCRFIDTKQWTSLSNLLTDDTHLVFKDTKGELLYEFFDRDQLISITSEMLQAAVSIHHVCNPEIELLSPITAKAIWAMEDQIIFPENENTPYQTMHGYGHYYETLEKSGGEWKIKSLTLERLKLDFTY